MIECLYKPKNREELDELINDRSIHLGDIDTSLINDMSFLFCESERKNKDFEGIENWNVSNVTNMESMFEGCKHFNRDLSKWDVSNLRKASSMFCKCSNFNKPLNDWNTYRLEEAFCMFAGCHKFNQPLDKWKTDNLWFSMYMFSGCLVLDQDFSSWGLKYYKDQYMFQDCDKLHDKLMPLLLPIQLDPTDSEFVNEWYFGYKYKKDA